MLVVFLFCSFFLCFLENNYYYNEVRYNRYVCVVYVCGINFLFKRVLGRD